VDNLATHPEVTGLLKSIENCYGTGTPVLAVCPAGSAAVSVRARADFAESSLPVAGLPIARYQRGLTMLEIMISIAVLGVILAIGIPSYAHITISSGLTSDTNDLVASMQFARSEAITRGEAVTVCAANATLDACSGGGDWASGWVILDAATNPIRVHPALTQNAAVEVNVQNGVGAVVFNRNGFSTNSRTIRLCGPRGDTRRIRGVVVSPDGRIRLAADLNGNNVVEDQDGNDLGC
jgi:type IV fimbrial biogenesis protein FimT